MPLAVHFREAVVLLGRFPAIAGLDLEVDEGEVVLLRGPNGAGKTTLLRACAGLVPVVRGDARVLGVDLRTEATSVRPLVGLMGPAAGLYGDLTVADNVRFWCGAMGVEADEGFAAAEITGLSTRLLDVAVGRLSTGQRRRLSLALLVARRPRLWLLDEPHSGMDNGGRDLVDGLITDAAAAGATVLLASHEHDRAARVAHRAVIIAGGMAEPGPATEVLDRAR